MAQVVFGQTNEGMITYETKINVHRTLPKEREEMKKMIPEFRVSQQQPSSMLTNHFTKTLKKMKMIGWQTLWGRNSYENSAAFC